MRKARGFSLFPSTFPRKTHLSKKRSCVLLAPFADGLTPTAEAQGKNFTSPRRMCAEMRTRSLFFIFACFLCGENTLYLHRKPVLSTPHGKISALRPRFSLARRSALTHSSPAYDASFRHPFAQCRLSGARPKHPGRHPGPASHFPAGTTSRHGATVTHRQPLRAEQRPAHRHLRRIGRHPPLRRLPAAQLERRHRTL